LRSKIFRAILLSLLFPLCHGQSPTDGRVLGNAYVNSYFRLSYEWPKTLKPYDTKSLNLPQSSPYASEFLLFSARQEDAPFGVIVFAEKLNVPTAHSTGIKDGTDFLDRAIQALRPSGKPKILSRTHLTNANGRVFEVLDYLIDGEYTSGIVTQVGQYLIVFKCNAKSVADLSEMNNSAFALSAIK
jgi:hypothetical protein